MGIRSGFVGELRNGGFEGISEGYRVFLGYALQPLILAVCIGLFVTLMKKG